MIKKQLYSIVFKKDYKFEILANFLIQDAYQQGSFKKWAKLSNDKTTSNNGTVLEKIDNNVVLHLNSYFRKYSLTIEIDQFIHILKKWHRLLLRNMPFILIKEEDGRYTIISSRLNPTVTRCIDDEDD